MMKGEREDEELLLLAESFVPNVSKCIFYQRQKKTAGWHVSVISWQKCHKYNNNPSQPNYFVFSFWLGVTTFSLLAHAQSNGI